MDCIGIVDTYVQYNKYTIEQKLIAEHICHMYSQSIDASSIKCKDTVNEFSELIKWHRICFKPPVNRCTMILPALGLEISIITAVYYICTMFAISLPVSINKLSRCSSADLVIHLVHMVNTLLLLLNLESLCYLYTVYTLSMLASFLLVH